MPRFYHHIVPCYLLPFSQPPSPAVSDANGSLIKSVRDHFRYGPVVKADQLEKTQGLSRGATVKTVAIVPGETRREPALHVFGSSPLTLYGCSHAVNSSLKSFEAWTRRQFTF